MQTRDENQSQSALYIRGHVVGNGNIENEN